MAFDLPDLPQMGGRDIRFFRNQSFANNTANFAPEGNIVGLVPAGTGMLIMAWNVFKTIAGAQPVDVPVLAVEPAHA